MNLTNVMTLLGGLALFLYGMQMMSTGLEAAAGDRMKGILEKLTANRFLGVLVGAGITAVIQSSSATTVMVVGFVNARMMSLKQAVWIIMGANIGTTITGQLIALDIGAFAPLIAFLGVATVLFVKNQKAIYWGQIVAGLGVLFIGMDLMSNAMLPLRESEYFIELMTNFSNPLFGILVGAGFTALIQSSSASVGILQALAATGLIDLSGAVYILFGQNIGTCITAVLASIGTNREAKQTTIIHLSFNIIGTIIFTTVCMLTPLTTLVEGWTPNNAQAQIANMHTFFNIVTTLILLPFGTYLAAFAQRILPEKKDEKSKDGLLYLQPIPSTGKAIGLSAINVKQVHDEVVHMMTLVYQNAEQSLEQLKHFKEDVHRDIVEREDKIDYLNNAIAEYISGALSTSIANPEISNALGAYYLMLVDLERISDNAINIDKQAKLNKKYLEEDNSIVDTMKANLEKMKDSLLNLGDAQKQDKDIRKMTQKLRDEQIQKLKDKGIKSEVAIMFSRVFTDYERINAHLLNVAEELEKIDLNLHGDEDMIVG